MSRHREIEVSVNGVAYRETISTRMTLADFLRDRLRLTGTHLGCEHGVCGACTVDVDGAAVRSCLLLAVQVDGCEVTTVEGLADGDQLSALQRAFRDHHALQFGFCTPGMLMSLHGFLADTPSPSRDDVVHALSGNLCRCTGYSPIIKATLAAAAELAKVTGTASEGEKR
jgi:carbon-monoxide dehydrogenase small subunit